MVHLTWSRISLQQLHCVMSIETYVKHDSILVSVGYNYSLVYVDNVI